MPTRASRWLAQHPSGPTTSGELTVCWLVHPMTGSGTACLTAREHLRVSHDKSGRERSLDEQHAENGRWSQMLGSQLTPM